MTEHTKLHDPDKSEVLSSLNYQEQKYLALVTFVKTTHNLLFLFFFFLGLGLGLAEVRYMKCLQVSNVSHAHECENE